MKTFQVFIDNDEEVEFLFELIARDIEEAELVARFNIDSEITTQLKIYEVNN